MEDFKLEKALHKWSPILDALKVTEEKKRKIMAEYAETHSQMESESLVTFPGSNTLNVGQDVSPDIGQNLLPVSLKILAQLNLENKNVILKQGLPSLSFSTKANDVELEEIKKSEFGAGKGMEIVQRLENVLTETLVNYINKELETKDNLYITTIAQSISLISEKMFEPVMFITSRIHIE